MAKPKVYVHRLGAWYGLYMDDANEALLRSFAQAVSEGARETPLGPEELVERMAGCSAILSLNGIGVGEITREVLRRVGTIKAVSIAHWWGPYWEEASQVGIAVVEGSNANTVAVAEWTIAAALAGVRRLQTFDRRLKAGSPWGEPRRQVGLLCESTVGLVGLGRIGWYVAHYFQALGAKVLGFDQDTRKAEELGLPLVSLDELLRVCDVVSLHLPVTPETTGILGAREFALIKDGAVLINSARAALCDEAALVEELRKGRFAAYLDVFATEPLPLDHPFRTLDNVVLTPHIAGDNATMFARCGREAILTLRDYFEGKGLRNRQYAFP
jgi:phosphoglycerate dehydrogenase-like enzyme